MLVRELRDKLNRIPEEYLDLEVCTYNTEGDIWQMEDIVASVNIWQHKRYGGVFLGIGENFSEDFRKLWPDLERERE